MRDVEAVDFMKEWFPALAEDGHGRLEEEGFWKV